MGCRNKNKEKHLHIQKKMPNFASANAQSVGPIAQLVRAPDS